MSAPIAAAPLVSILMFCRNNVGTVGRAIQSVLGTGYANLEIVVQDGASTDGTLEVLRGFGGRIKLVSEPDDGPSEAFQRALRRCEGSVIGSCLADEELLPGAIDEAVRAFGENGSAGAIIGNTILTDGDGHTTGRAEGRKFDIVDYLFGNDAPYFCSCFFARAALEEIGVLGDDIEREGLEFEIWTRLATHFETKHIPCELAKYAIRETQLSNTAAAMLRHIDARAAVIGRFFSRDGFFGDDPKLRDYSLLCQYRQFFAHAVTYGVDEVRRELGQRIAALSDDGSSGFTADWLNEQTARRYWLAFGNLFPPRLKRRVLELGLHRLARPLFMRAAALAVRRGSKPTTDAPTKVTGDEAARLIICHEMAKRYEARGQIETALRYWRRAEALDDPAINSFGVQAMQKAPSFDGKRILAGQRRWVERHAPFPAKKLPATPRSGRKLRVGYHCVWWDSPVARHQLLNFIRHHDREKIDPICYSPVAVARDVEEPFAQVRVTGNLGDEAFAALARSDGLDVFVETTGFSPDHRYAAMARRCAPVQISYVNHHATTAVPNVDYVLGDTICASGADAPFFTETIYQLPGCFFCFDLRDDDIPHTETPPAFKRGYVTFGCFGSGGKFNDPLISLWAEILKRTPTAKLRLQNTSFSSPPNRRFVAARFARHGIGEDRLLLVGGVDHQAILAAYGEIDISLDTWPYCGGNTIAESLWQGVPAIGLLGDRFSARYGASLLEAQGCTDLVASTPEQYVTIASALAHDRERLAMYRSQLRQMIGRHGFNDSEKFAGRIEAAYEDMLSAVLRENA